MVVFCLMCGMTVLSVNAAKPEKCTNGIDDDGDQLVDCDDPDCFSHLACQDPPPPPPSEPDTTRYMLTLDYPDDFGKGSGPHLMCEGPNIDPWGLPVDSSLPIDLIAAECGKQTLEDGCPKGTINASFGSNETRTPCAEVAFVLPGADLTCGTGDDIRVNTCGEMSGLGFYFSRNDGVVDSFQLYIRDVNWDSYFTDAGIPVDSNDPPVCVSGGDFTLELNAEALPVYMKKGRKLVGTVSLGYVSYVKDNDDIKTNCLPGVSTCRCP